MALVATSGPIQGKIIGIVKECRVANSRNSGKKYCKLIVSDEKAEINCFIWQELLDELSEKGSIPNKENIVSVRVRKMDGNGCSVNQLTTLDEQIYMKLSDLR